MDYAAYLELDIEHPLVDPLRWSLLPGGAAGRFLAAQRLRQRFGPAGASSLRGAAAVGLAADPDEPGGLPDQAALPGAGEPSGPARSIAGAGNAARLSFIGESGWCGGAGLQRLVEGIERLDFYLFCREPYFSRVTDSPAFRPGRELLHFDFSALAAQDRNSPVLLTENTGASASFEEGRDAGASAAAGRKKKSRSTAGQQPEGVPLAAFGAGTPESLAQPLAFRLDAGAAKVLVFDDGLQAEVAQARKKYLGTPFGAPPLGLLSLPPWGRRAVANLGLVFAPRKLWWVYEIYPCPGQPLRVEGGPCEFRSAGQESGAGGNAGASGELLLSSSMISLPMSPLPRLRLLLEGSGGQTFPLLENLPLPGPAQVCWDKELNDFKAVVKIDLSRFGLSC